MESQIKSSFIPPDTGSAPVARRPQRSAGADLATLAGVILLVASLALAVGVFLYVQFLETNLANKQEQLQRAQAAFEPALIEELTRLDERLRTAGDLLYAHVAPSELLRVLEELTLETVSFRNMEFFMESPTRITLTLDGVAESVNSIALQADLFGKHMAITSPIFSNITRQEDGRVQFDVSALVNPNSLKYPTVLRARTGGTSGSLEQLQQPGTVPPEEETQLEDESAIPIFVP